MIAYYEVKTEVKSQVIDYAVLNEIKEFMGEEGESTVTELIGIYLKNTPLAISRVAEDLKTGDIVALGAHIHGLKGSSAGVGAVGISATCRQIEEAIHADKLDSIYELFERLINIYKQVEMEFRERL